jgi:hypothetical protein
MEAGHRYPGARAAGLVAAFMICGAPPPGHAQSIVAIVEDVSGAPTSVALLDYLTFNQVIQLKPADTVTISYFSSCIREVISGGTITIQLQQSDVVSGKVERTTADCDANRMIGETAREFLPVAGTVVRRLSVERTPQFTLYGLSPLVKIDRPGVLIFDRLDRDDGDASMLEVPIERTDMRQGAFVDLANRQTSLVAGATYRAIFGPGQVVFSTHPTAKAGPTPVAGRLLNLASVPNQPRNLGSRN